jgi:hypothetical protein
MHLSNLNISNRESGRDLNTFRMSFKGIKKVSAWRNKAFLLRFHTGNGGPNPLRDAILDPFLADLIKVLDRKRIVR